MKEGVLSGTIVCPATAGAGVELAAKSARGEQVGPASSLPILPFPPLEELAARR